MATYITATKARKDFFNLIRKTQAPGHFVTITIEGLPAVTMMSAGDFDGWQETLEIMSDPDLVQQIKASETDLKKGVKGAPWKKVKRDLGW